MKNSNLLLLGGAALAAYFLFFRKGNAAAATTDTGGGLLSAGMQGFPWNLLGQAWQAGTAAGQQAAQATQNVPTATYDMQKGIMEYVGGLVGTGYRAVAGSPQLGQTSLSYNQGLSSTFNMFATGGLMTTGATANFIALNPNMNISQRQAVQSALTTAAIASGAGVASRINWGQTQSYGGYNYPVGGGVITNYAGLSPSAPTVNLASLFATGRIG